MEVIEFKNKQLICSLLDPQNSLYGLTGRPKSWNPEPHHFMSSSLAVLNKWRLSLNLLVQVVNWCELRMCIICAMPWCDVVEQPFLVLVPGDVVGLVTGTCGSSFLRSWSCSPELPGGRYSRYKGEFKGIFHDQETFILKVFMPCWNGWFDFAGCEVDQFSYSASLWILLSAVLQTQNRLLQGREPWWVEGLCSHCVLTDVPLIPMLGNVRLTLNESATRFHTCHQPKVASSTCRSEFVCGLACRRGVARRPHREHPLHHRDDQEQEMWDHVQQEDSERQREQADGWAHPGGVLCPPVSTPTSTVPSQGLTLTLGEYVFFLCLPALQTIFQ